MAVRLASRGRHRGRGSKYAVSVGQHIAKKRSLLDSIVQSDMRVLDRIERHMTGARLAGRVAGEPLFGHVFLDGIAVTLLKQSHGIGLDVQG